jgi:hypothetical protein
MRVIAIFLFAGLIGSARLSAQQKKKGRCNGAPPDSTWLLRGPVYRDCEVDTKAEVIQPEPLPDYSPMGTPRPGCFSAEFEFVVDTLGEPEILTIRPTHSNDRGLEDALRSSIPKVRFTPARLADRRVRQLVVYKRTMGVARVTSRDPLPPVMPPRC